MINTVYALIRRKPFQATTLTDEILICDNFWSKMEDLSSEESHLEGSDLSPLSTADEEHLSLADIPMVYKAHAAVGAAIFIEGF